MPAFNLPNAIGPTGTPRVITGNGNQTFAITNPSGAKRPFLVRTDYESASGYDSIWVNGLDASGALKDYFFGGTKTHGVRLLESGSSEITQIQVEAAGPWKVTLIPLANARTWDGKSAISGSDADVLLIPSRVASSLKVKYTIAQDAYFKALFFSNDVTQTSLNMDETAKTLVLPSGTLVFSIDTPGTWAFAPTA